MSKKLILVFWLALLLLSACSARERAAPPGSTLIPATPTPTTTPDRAPSSTPGAPAVLPSPTPLASLETPVAGPTQPAQPTSAPTTASTAASSGEPTPPGTPPPDCTNIAAYISDVTIPDGTLFRPGEAFKKTWRVANDGDCTWGDGYALVFAGGESLNGAFSNPLPLTGPEKAVEVSVDLSAPQQPGPFTGYWQFQDPQGRTFGTGFTGSGLLWVQINVSSFSSSSATHPGSVPVSTSSDCSATRDASVESQVLALVNQARAANGLGALTLRGELSAAALQHSTDMTCNDYVSHVGSDGSSWYDRAAAQGYANAATARENLYVGDPAFGGTAQGAFDWWMNSAIHRDNILYPDVTEIGIAYVYNPNSEYKGYYVMLVARPYDH